MVVNRGAHADQRPLLGMLAMLATLAGSMFALSELVEGWRWRVSFQAGLVLLSLLNRAEAPDRLLRLLAIAGGFVLTAAGWQASSSGLVLLGALLVAVNLVPVLHQRAHPLGTFTMSAGTTLGLVCLYVHGPVVWEWPRMFAVLRGLLDLIGRLWPATPTLLTTGEVVHAGTSVHLSALSVLLLLPLLVAFTVFLPCRLWQGVLVSFGTLFASVLLRGVAGFVAVRVERPDWIAHPAFDVAFLVAAGLIALFLSTTLPTAPRPPSRKPRIAIACAFLIAAGLHLGLSPRLVPRGSQLTIAIDDAHGTWERTDLPFGTQRYGRDTVYTYTLLREWLSRRYSIAILNELPIVPEGDVLLIKMPVVPYSTQERESISAFVRRGGGLIVLGDHTNLFGTTGHINELLAGTGVRLRDDAAIPFQGVTRTFAPRWYQDGPLVACGTAFDFATSATIASTSLRAQPLMVDLGVMAEKAQYSNERNFGDLRPSLDDRFPPLVTAALMPWGRGRIVVLADSTPWSNFSFFTPGTKEVLDRAIRVVAPGARDWVRKLALLAAVAGILVALFLRLGIRPIVVWSFSLYALLTALLSPTRAGMEPTAPRPGSEEKGYVVDAVHSSFRWDSDVRTLTPRDRDTYSTFFAWTSRADLWPEFENRAPYADAKRPVLVLNPVRPVSAASTASIEEYVRRGGRLLVLDDPLTRPGTTAPDLLRLFGIQYQPQTAGSSIHTAAGPSLPELVWTLPLALLAEALRQPGPVLADRAGLGYTLLGVTPEWVDEDGLVVYGTKAYGAGSVHVFIRSSVFSQMVLGDVWGGVEPGKPKEQLYDLEYRLLAAWYPGSSALVPKVED